jgi:hypothetical protein
MVDPMSVALAATVWLLRFLFLSGWHVGKWIAWLTSPIWASAFGLGALRSLL